MAIELAPCCDICTECGGPSRRFKVGDRVLAKVGNGEDGWRAGAISDVDYRESDWRPERESSPYQILLDSDCRFEKVYVHAPRDCDSVVRAIPKHVQDMAKSLYDNRKCTDCGEQCPFHHVCEDKIACPKYHFCGKEGRRKTRLWKRLADRQLQDTSDVASRVCQACQDGDCEEPIGASVDATLTFVEGQHGQKATRKTRKANGRARQVPKAESQPTQPELRHHCECDCHAVAAGGRKAVVAMLREGMDFSSMFREELFETGDMDPDYEQELASFKWRVLVEV